MKRMCFGALAFTLAAAFATMASAQKVTLEQARAECRQQHQNVGSFRAQERGGVSVSQKVSDCVKQRMGKR